jgi:hypothetical protein
MKHVRVDVVMANKLLKPAEVRRVLRALQTQCTRDFAKVWDVHAELAFVGKPEHANPGAWQLALVDEEDDDYFGYHQLTREGLPLGRVLLRTAMPAKSTWSSTASHELLEMLVNPDTQRAVFTYAEDIGGRVYMCEVCDPCQDDPFCYEIHGVPVSDFILPEWFETWRKPRSAAFDHRKKLGQPFEVAKGGYMSFYDSRRRKWVEDYGSHLAKGMQPVYGYGVRGGSRRLLRGVPRARWKSSRL